jgi:hypothetical protein
MNRYILFTADGREFSVTASHCEDAIERVEREARSRVECWFVGVVPSRWAITLL